MDKGLQEICRNVDLVNFKDVILDFPFFRLLKNLTGRQNRGGFVETGLQCVIFYINKIPRVRNIAPT